MRHLGGRKLPEGWADPYALLRDPDWEANYPMLLLRGIYDVMERKRKEEEADVREIIKRREAARKANKGTGKPIPGDVERRYLAGFNMSVWSLVNAKPPRLHMRMVSNGIISREALTAKGVTREAEVRGLRTLSKESKARIGNKSRNDMHQETIKKMRGLRRLIKMVIATTAEEVVPPSSNPVAPSSV